MQRNNKEQIALTASQCAELLQVSMTTMYQLLNRDDFPAIKVGAHWRVNAKRLQEWMDNKERETV